MENIHIYFFRLLTYMQLSFYSAVVSVV